MSAINFAAPHMFLLLWGLPVVLFFYLFASYRRKQALRAFADSEILARISSSVNMPQRRRKTALTMIALAVTMFALTRPGWNPKPQRIVRRGRDVVFAVDVSRSMLAEDLAPNRLARAKLSILDSLERLGGDRVALVVFAGTAAVKCPLTLDYGFFRSMVDAVSADSVSRGGTLIGDAIRLVSEDVFDDRERRYKDIILITDGEDHDSFPIDAAKQAGERGIRLLAVGLGDEDMGRRVPIVDEQGRRTFLKYEGEEVWTRLDGDTLRKMVNATPGGRYINVATGSIDLGDIYVELIGSAEKKELQSKTVERFEEKYQVFLGLALLMLCVESSLRERTKGRDRRVA